MRNVEWCSDFDTVQDLWNDIECKVIKIVDNIAPLRSFINNVIPQSIPPQIKAKINKRNRLLKKKKTNCSNELKLRICSLTLKSKTFI